MTSALRPLGWLDRARGRFAAADAPAERVVVVTGAANGIGRASCEALAAAGATVAMLDVVEEVEALGGIWRMPVAIASM